MNFTLGNLISSQLFDAASDALPDLSSSISRGEFEPLLEWLRTNVHAHGRRYPADELVERATGSPLSSAPFLNYIRTIANDVYGV